MLPSQGAVFVCVVDVVSEKQEIKTNDFIIPIIQIVVEVDSVDNVVVPDVVLSSVVVSSAVVSLTVVLSFSVVVSISGAVVVGGSVVVT